MRWVFDRASTRAEEFGIQVGPAAASMLGIHTRETSRAMQPPHRYSCIRTWWETQVGRASQVQQATLPTWSAAHARPGAAA